MAWEQEQIGTCTLYRADALEVVPTLARIDAVITDPPYGNGWQVTKDRRKKDTSGLHSIYSQGHPWSCVLAGNDQAFDPSPWLAYGQLILWGAQYYAHRLPVSPVWLIWDKRIGHRCDDFGDAELAWTNLATRPRVVRMHRQLWRGLIRAGEENAVHGPKLHPTQKPIALMRWCVEKTTGTVLDPYMGSGTTGAACLELGRPFIGIEIERQYFEVACTRLTQAAQQLRLGVG